MCQRERLRIVLLLGLIAAAAAGSACETYVGVGVGYGYPGYWAGLGLVATAADQSTTEDVQLPGPSGLRSVLLTPAAEKFHTPPFAALGSAATQARGILRS